MDPWAVAQKEFALNGGIYHVKKNDPRVDWHDIFSKVKCPTLLVIPDHGILSLKDAKRVLPEFANAEIAYIEGAGHNVRREQFDQFMVAVRSFIQ